MLRAFVRITVVLVPAMIYIGYGQPKGHWRQLLTKHALSGMLWGVGATAVLFVTSLPMLLQEDASYRLPSGLAIWLNWILLSPFAEELLFRGIVFKELYVKIGLWKSTALSSFFFILLHLPPILALQSMESWTEIGTYCVNLFVLSILFTLAFHYSRSLWGSLLPHWVNNLLSIGLTGS